ncbi:MAG TPA: serine/threonine-protein kinase, partial [Thermoanaerobaculia bacterium]|nr:serine/threonine-protein kinase [Thermoanaerobaculia bacterium]
MSLDRGSRLGRYEVRSLIGTGGMGEVYLAHDPDLERDVAIKILRDGSTSSDRVRRFVQEAKAASALHHPNVAHVYEIGTHGEMRFIAMELLEGETLRRRIDAGPLPVGEALSLATQIAAGLAAAHNAGIIHRDIQPENVIILADGYAKILDFGLAKLREREGPDAATLLKTEPGFTMGTLGYMAPEQLAGGEITPAADVFSLGVVLYEMLAGRRPFEGTTATEIAGAIISKPPPPLNRPGVPPALEKVIFRALEKSAGGRYGNAGEMLQALRELSGEMAATGVPGGVAGRRSWKRVAGVAAAMVILALIAGAAWMALLGKRERDAERLIATAEGHLRRGAYPEAYGAAVAAASMFPDNERLRNVIANSSEKVVIESDPPGASVHLRRFKGSPEGQDAGTTPLTIPRLAWADYLVTITKEGYAAAVLPMSTAPAFFRGQLMRRHSPHLEVD